VKVLSESNSKIIKNASYLTAVQAGTYLFPLLITSFLVRTIGPFAFGKISYVQNFVLYLLVFLNYGFDFMVTKEISIAHDDQTKLLQIVWASLYLKLLLLVTTFILVIVSFFFIERLNSDPVLYLSTSLILLGYALFPNWYFQGLEKMKVMSIFNFLVKLLPFVLIYFTVKSPGDYLIVPFSNSVFQIVVGLASLYFCLADFDFVILPIKELKSKMIEIISKCTPIFLSTLVQSWHSLGNFMVLGWFVSEAMLGYYSVVQRTILAFLILTQLPFNFALYPHFIKAIATSREQAILLFQKIFVLTLAASVGLSLVLYFSATIITIALTGIQNAETISAFRLLSVLPIFWGVTCITNFQGLYAFGYERFSPFISTLSAVISLLLTISLAPSIGIQGACWGWLCGQAAEVIQGLIVLHKKGIRLSWNPKNLL
jgi:polysaccharide transporter, PST family